MNERRFVGTVYDRERGAYVYEWPAPAHEPALCHFRHVAGLPWPVRVLEDRPWSDGVLLVRTDLGPLWRLTDARYRARLWARLTKMRIIRTAAIWGIGHTPEGIIPDWSDLRRKKP